MFNKIFKEPNKLLKIISVALIAAAVIGSVIWILVEKNSVDLMSSDLAVQDDIFKGLLQDKILIVLSFVFSVLSLVLLICWLAKMIRQPDKVLKNTIIALTFIALGVLLIWCVSEVCYILTTDNEIVKTAYTEIKTKYPELTADKVILVNAAIVDVYNNEAEAIVTLVLTVVISAFGVVISALVLYGLVDGFGRVVRSLEKMAENSKVNNEKEKVQCVCDKEKSAEA